MLARVVVLAGVVVLRGGVVVVGIGLNPDVTATSERVTQSLLEVLPSLLTSPPAHATHSRSPLR